MKTLTFPATALLCLGILGLGSPHRQILTWCDKSCVWHILTSLVTTLQIHSEGFLSLLVLLALARSPEGDSMYELKRHRLAGNVWRRQM